MELTIRLQLPQPGRDPGHATNQEACGSLEEQIREALELINSGHESYKEWKMINSFYAVLKKKKRVEGNRVDRLMKMMEPVMAKYGVYGVPERK